MEGKKKTQVMQGSKNKLKHFQNNETVGRKWLNMEIQGTQ